ncbi:MAG: hypothetical protein ACLSA6_12635 [Holdemania massiliensis]
MDANHSAAGGQKITPRPGCHCPCLELMRIVWLFLLGEGYWVKLLPLHLCGLQVLFIPLAVFTRSSPAQLCVATSILGGITAIVIRLGLSVLIPFSTFRRSKALPCICF